MQSPTHSHHTICRSHSHRNFLTTLPAPDTLPQAAHRGWSSQQFTQSAQPPPRPRRRGAHGSWGADESVGAQSTLIPHPVPFPPPRVTKRATAPLPARHLVGGGETLQERKLTCPFWGRKKFGSQPLPRYSAQADSWGAGPPERARSALCSELGPEGEGKGGGWAPTSAPPPHPSSAPRLHVGRPPLHRGRAQPPQEARRLLAWPRGPGAHKLSPRRQPHAPHSLGPPGSDRCLGDRLSFVPKERGTRAGSPALPVGAPPAAPTSSCHSAAPGPARPPWAGGGAAGG